MSAIQYNITHLNSDSFPLIHGDAQYLHDSVFLTVTPWEWGTAEIGAQKPYESIEFLRSDLKEVRVEAYQTRSEESQMSKKTQRSANTSLLYVISPSLQVFTSGQ
ncbi:hypothetical protein KIL84_000726 [Mauremys mutica]|uniref:Uncharacterized protein n=1 Tax=Mauremys mutica TaxID=74926 RepID=A0A9D4AV34_9SAUR|nr:hypothetical protein KIL84_000726 [Mauremys mutica]